MIVKNYFEDPSVFRLNTEPDRAYFVPYSTKEAAMNVAGKQLGIQTFVRHL